MSTAGIWLAAIVLAVAAVFAIAYLVQATKGPRRFFRGGSADPRGGGSPIAAPGSSSPQTVEEPVADDDPLTADLGEEAAAVIEGERHGPSSGLDAGLESEARGAVDATAAPAAPGPPPPEPAGAPSAPGSDAAAEPLAEAAREHRHAAEEHRKAAEALEGGPVSPGEESETGPVYPFERRPGDSRGHPG